MLGESLGDAGEKENLAEETLSTSLTFEQRLQLQEREILDARVAQEN